MDEQIDDLAADSFYPPASYQGTPPPPPNAFTAANFAALVARVSALEEKVAPKSEEQHPDEPETEEPVETEEPAIESNVVHAENVESADNVEHAERVGSQGSEQNG